jgi:hypothetical protein
LVLLPADPPSEGRTLEAFVKDGRAGTVQAYFDHLATVTRCNPETGRLVLAGIGIGEA